MIKYALVCAFEHPFEGWFGSSDEYDDQLARRQIACPFCGATDVRKQIMAPAVAGTKAQGGTLAISEFRPHHDDGGDGPGAPARAGNLR